MDQAGVQGCPGTADGLNRSSDQHHTTCHTHRNGHGPLLRAATPTTPAPQRLGSGWGRGGEPGGRVPSLIDEQGQAPSSRRQSTCHPGFHRAGREVPPAHPPREG